MQSVARVPKSTGVAVPSEPSEVKCAVELASLKRMAGLETKAPRGSSVARFLKSQCPGTQFCKRSVELRPVAFAYVPSPKNTLQSVFQNLRQAAQASKSTRIAGRFVSPSSAVCSSVVVPAEFADLVALVALRTPGAFPRH